MKELLFAQDDVTVAITDAWNQIPDHFPHASVDQFVVMPNHVHGIVWIVREPSSVADANVAARHASPPHARPRGAPSGSLGAIIGSFKSASTKRINELRRTPGAPLWQRNYYERVIRDEDELHRIRKYIINNPAKWQFDRENPSRLVDAPHDAEWAWLHGDGGGVVARHASPLQTLP